MAKNQESVWMNRPPESGYERTSLESDSLARIKRRLTYLQLDDAEVRRLSKLGSLVAAQEEEIIDELYAHLLQIDEAKRFIADEKTLQKLKCRQKEYFNALVGAKYDDDYILSRQRVGSVHYQMGLTPDIYLSAYSKYIELVLARVLTHCQNPQEYQAYSQALRKIVMFDISIAVDSYSQANEDILHQNMQDLESLNSAAMELAVSGGLKDRIRNALLQVQKIFAPKASAIAFYDKDSARLTSWEVLGVDKALIEAEAEYLHTLGMECLSKVVPLMKENITDAIRAQGFSYIFAVPLRNEGIAVGVLYLFEQRENRYYSLKLNKLLTLSHLIASALVNARTHEETLFHATHDPLTGLANRRLFDKYLQQGFERSQRAGVPMTMIMFDLDHFKSINDEYGHAVGDQVLKQISAMVKGTIRKGDLAARYGGEEICVLMENIDGSTAKKKADIIRREIEATAVILADGNAIYITASAGVVCYPRCAGSPGGMLEKGDQALYMAKQQGRNQVVLYREMLKSEIEKKPERITELLREGYENIQPIVTAVDLKNRYYREHSNQVAKLASAFARYLELDEKQSIALQRAALLQDVGMIYLPDSLLNKSGELTADETAMFRQHTIKGAELMAGIANYAELAQVVRHHHEFYDGSGYPDGLRGEAIPWQARILRILDSYAAFTTDRPQRSSITSQDALIEIQKLSGRRFDPELVAQFVDFMHGH